jgi:Spy/CpxP family protein refolding chaperone
MSAESDPRRIHLWTAVVLLAVFLAGGVTGAGLVWATRPRDPRPAGPRPRIDGLPGPLAELGLTPEQVAKARAVVESHRAELQAAVEESFPRVRAVQDRVDAELRALLTPEQAARFDEMRRRRPPLRGPGFGGPPPGEPPGGPRGGPPGAPPDGPPRRPPPPEGREPGVHPPGPPP